MSAKRKDTAPEPKASAPIDEATSAPKAPVVAEQAPAVAAPEPEAPAALEVPSATAQAPVYRVAKGRSITSPRGILDAGTVVDPARDGIADLDALVRIGAVVAS